jgi:predicted GIY-YIG superfamily endonuclease
MSDPTLIADLIRAGASMDLVNRAAAAIRVQPPLRNPSYAKQPTFVYALVDPRTQAWFYVGITIMPEARLQNHRTDRSSAAWERIQEIERAGFECEMDIVAEYADRNEALRLEYDLIMSSDGLVNRDRGFRQMFNYEALAR